MPRKAQRHIAKYSFDEISFVGDPAHEPARITLAKRRKSGEEQPTTEIRKMSDETKPADNSAELEKRDKEIAELKAELAKAKQPAPEVILKREGGEDVTTASSELEQELAKEIVNHQYEKQAREIAPNVEEKTAVALLKSGEKDALVDLEKIAKGDETKVAKQRAAFIKSGVAAKMGEGESDDADEQAEAALGKTANMTAYPEEQITSLMKSKDMSRIDAVLAIAAQRDAQAAAAH